MLAKKREAAVLGKLARAAYMLFVAMMIVAWAMTAGKTSPAAAPEPEDAVVTWWC